MTFFAVSYKKGIPHIPLKILVYWEITIKKDQVTAEPSIDSSCHLTGNIYFQIIY